MYAMSNKALNTEIPAIVRRALTETVCDIGQLSAADKRTLNSYIKRGYLAKGKGGPFPRLKTIYAVSTFDFSADRERWVEHAAYLGELDAQALGDDRYRMRTVNQRAQRS
jgi:hypothetical protein